MFNNVLSILGLKQQNKGYLLSPTYLYKHTSFSIKVTEPFRIPLNKMQTQLTDQSLEGQDLVLSNSKQMENPRVTFGNSISKYMEASSALDYACPTPRNCTSKCMSEYIRAEPVFTYSASKIATFFLM